MKIAGANQHLPGISIDQLWSDRNWGLVLSPQRSVDPTPWAAANATQINQLISDFGAILFRGFDVTELDAFESFASALIPLPPAFYREAATPRTHLHGNVFTSTEYPKDCRIYVHNENSHVTKWPRYLLFCCAEPAQSGGATPLADCGAIPARLPEAVVDRFSREGWLYRRNFFKHSNIPWQKAFSVENPEALEAYCNNNFMNPEWTSTGLTLRYRRWATVRHPTTQKDIWFNHGMFFNSHSLEPLLKEVIGTMGDDQLSSNTYHGDGSKIDQATLEAIDEAYQAETAYFDWQRGDVLLVDNMRIAHGRHSYRGNRRILVTMKSDVSCFDFEECRRFCL